MKNVIDVYERNVTVNDEKKKLYSFSNKDKKIRWNAPIIEDGKETGFFTDYIEKGTVTDVRLKLRTWNNVVLLAYAASVGFKANENDPSGEKWDRVVDYVENHQSDFFTKTGDFRKKLVITEDQIRKMIK